MLIIYNRSRSRCIKSRRARESFLREGEREADATVECNNADRARE